MPGKNIHVVPTHNGWAIETEGGFGSQQRFTSQEHAIATGTEKAKRAKVELLIHGRDGEIRERNSFGNADPSDITDVIRTLKVTGGI